MRSQLLERLIRKPRTFQNRVVRKSRSPAELIRKLRSLRNPIAGKPRLTGKLRRTFQDRMVRKSQLQARLVGILREKALRALDEPVRLSAGGWSSHFIDGKNGLAAWRDLQIACRAINEAVEGAGISFDAVGGLTLGADALAVGTAAVSDTSWFVVRKEPKAHGTGQRIEGASVGPGIRTLVVDDVVTTGGSILKALDAVEETGAEVVAVATLVDRGDRARPRLEARGIDHYFSMATYEDLRIEPVTLPADVTP